MRARGDRGRMGAESVVVVVGGGIAGLALAAALARERARRGGDGPTCVVLERDESAAARRQGYGVTLSETNAALAGLGVAARCRERNCKSSAHWTFGASGRVLGYYGTTFLSSRSSPTGAEGSDEKERPPTNLRVPRNEVRGILLEEIPRDWIKWGAKLRDYVEDEDGVRVTLESGETVEGTILVAADGVRSGTRRAPSAGDDVKSGALAYLGVALVTGFTDLDNALLRGQGFYTVDGRSRLFTMPFRAANEVAGTPPKSMWQLSVRVDEETARSLTNAPRSEVKDFVLEHTKGWHDPVGAMLETTNWEDAWAGPLYDREEPPTSKARAAETPHLALRSSTSRVVCIGDAAHPMSPFKGQGANTALYDAWALSKWLYKAPPRAALACFHREMVVRAFVKVRASRDACETFHSPSILTERIPEFAGVDPTKIKLVLDTLNERGVNASMCAELEPAVQSVIDELKAAETVKPYAVKKQYSDIDSLSECDSSASDGTFVSFASSMSTCTLQDSVVNAVALALARADEPPLTDAERDVVRKLRRAVNGRRPSNDYASLAPIRLLASRGVVGDMADAREARFAREIADVINERAVALKASREANGDGKDDGDDDNVDDHFIHAKPTADGKVLLTTKKHDETLTSLGLKQCEGCLKYYAVHGGGLRKHWESGGENADCAASAQRAMACDFTETESSAWRGSGAGKPKAWRTASNRKELSPGMSAAARGNVDGMKRAIEEGWNPVIEKDAFGSNALMWAAGGGHIEACEFLVDECGVNPNHTKRKDGRVPLHWAARNGELEACQWLVSKGANPSTASYDGDFPFHLAIWKNHRKVAQWLGEASSSFDCGTTNRWGCNAVLWACTTESDQEDALSMVKWLIEEKKVDYSVVNVNGHSALHKCAIYGHESVIDYLLELIDSNELPEYIVPDDRNQAPSELARVNGFLELEKKLRRMEDETMRLPTIFVDKN